MPEPRREGDGDPAFLSGWLPRSAGRLAAAGLGLAIEYRVLFVADEVDYFLFLAGLWLMGIPFASLLESLRKLVEIQQGVVGGGGRDDGTPDSPDEEPPAKAG